MERVSEGETKSLRGKKPAGFGRAVLIRWSGTEGYKSSLFFELVDTEVSGMQHTGRLEGVFTGIFIAAFLAGVLLFFLVPWYLNAQGALGFLLGIVVLALPPGLVLVFLKTQSGKRLQERMIQQHCNDAKLRIQAILMNDDALEEPARRLELANAELEQVRRTWRNPSWIADLEEIVEIAEREAASGTGKEIGKRRS